MDQVSTEKARNCCYFRRLLDDERSITALLSSAETCWTTHPDLIFITEYRICGHPENIRTYLTEHGLAPAIIEAAIDNAITRRNYRIPLIEGGRLEVYTDEIQRRQTILKMPREFRRQIIFGAPIALTGSSS